MMAKPSGGEAGFVGSHLIDVSDPAGDTYSPARNLSCQPSRRWWSGVGRDEGGWHPHTAGGELPASAPGTEFDREADLSGPVVGIGAICDLRAPGDEEGDAEGDAQSFSVGEFVLVDGGRRVILHHDRGFTIGRGSAAAREGVNVETIVQQVLNTVLPDDEEESGDRHPWAWLAELARSRGLDVTAARLRGLGYEVVLTDRVEQWLQASHEPGG